MCIEFVKNNYCKKACRTFADKYIEHDSVLVFMDVLLLKHQAYRHILFNRIVYSSYGLNTRVLRLAFLLILFDVCNLQTF